MGSVDVALAVWQWHSSRDSSFRACCGCRPGVCVSRRGTHRLCPCPCPCPCQGCGQARLGQESNIFHPAEPYLTRRATVGPMPCWAGTRAPQWSPGLWLMDEPGSLGGVLGPACTPPILLCLDPLRPATPCSLPTPTQTDVPTVPSSECRSSHARSGPVRQKQGCPGGCSVWAGSVCALRRPCLASPSVGTGRGMEDAWPGAAGCVRCQGGAGPSAVPTVGGVCEGRGVCPGRPSVFVS